METAAAPELAREVARRRTFAIISHPDAGKTTLTEKLLLYGGAIRQAGSVKARKAARFATSDWMEIERQRGISVTSSAMQFDYDGYRLNILDTPGHQDFSEDTYRTLVAADSAVMLIDCARGVEEQTVKLFKVCRMRSIPIFTFVNKLDRAGKDPFDLLGELEAVLGIRSCPVSWPIGVHGDFKGVYLREERAVTLYRGGDHGASRAREETLGIDDPALPEAIGRPYLGKLREDVELLDEAGDPFDLERIRSGRLTPVFFGSASNNFGVEPFLRKFLRDSLPPAARDSDRGPIEPTDASFTGFVFKIQANMNPAHRDRLAFLRVCSGAFEKGMAARLARGGAVRLAQPQSFMAQEREAVERAYPGDIVGLFDPGVFRLGDTLYAGEPARYAGIPVFAPECFCRVSPVDSMKRKHFLKGISQLSQEGAIQTFRRPRVGREEIIAGAVGALQMDVMRHRLLGEYGAEIAMEALPYRYVRWIAKAPKPADRLRLTSASALALDRAGRDVILFENDWSIRLAEENNPGLALAETADRLDSDESEA